MKQCAIRLGLPVRQPEKIKAPEVVEELRAAGAEAMVVVGYGQIIPQSIIDLRVWESLTCMARCCRSIAGPRRFNGPWPMEKR